MAPGGSEIEGRKLMAEVVPNTLQGDQLYTESALHPGESRDLDLFFGVDQTLPNKKLQSICLGPPTSGKRESTKATAPYDHTFTGYSFCALIKNKLLLC